MCDMKFCTTQEQLREFLKIANENNYDIISVTYTCGYMVIYKEDKDI